MKTFALAAAVAVAQTLTQKIDVSVVNVDVVVTAKDGTPVRGLTRDDFQLFEDGAAQPITNFYAVESGVAAPASGAGPAAEAAAATPADDRFRRKVLVLIDSNHVSKYRRDAAIEKLEHFINDSFQAGDYDWSIAGIGPRLGVIMPLTSDKQRIHDTLAAIRAGGTRPDQTAIADLRQTEVRGANLSTMNRDLGPSTDFAHGADDRERSIRGKFAADALVDAVRGFGATGGKKIVLLLTDNSDLNDVQTSYDTHTGIVQRDLLSPRTTQDLPSIAREINQSRDRIIAEANASNVSLYIIDPEGLRAPGDISASNPSGTEGMTRHNAATWIAEQTGGKLLPGNDLGTSMTQFDAASSNYYSLGFRPARDDGKSHKLVVKLKKPGDYKVQHRAAYANVPSDAQLERALKSPILIAPENAPLPVTLMTEAAQPQKRGEVLVPFRARIPVSTLQFLPAGDKWNATIDIYVSVFDQNGKNITLNRVTTSATADSATPDPNGVFTYRNGILVRQGQQHRLVVAFRDRATDAVGMAETVVKPE